MRTEHHCRWVRPRLSLLAGGELGVEERRQVERHLIGCLGCRAQRDASTSALTALRAFAQESPVGGDAPSLWPSLAAQIRQSRHVAPRASWWELVRPRPWAALSLATGFVGMLAAVLMLPTTRSPQRPVVASVNSARPAKLPNVAFVPRGALPSGSPGALPKNGGGNNDSAQAAQSFNYDLDHGTPMGPGNRDPQHSY